MIGGRSPVVATAATVALALALTVLSACGSDHGPGEAGSSPSPSVTQVGTNSTTTSGVPNAATPKVTTVVAASVHEPTDLVIRPGDPDHLWLAERAGRVRRLTVADGGNSLTPAGDYLLDISDDTTTESERGLLGLAFSPDGATIYVSHTNIEGNTRIESYEMTGDSIDESSRKTVFSQEQPYPNHNGGHIVFGPDGKLWLGLGDGGSANDPQNHAQDPKSNLGKVLRIDPATDSVDSVIMGVRNPWRFAFDTDRSLWIGDVGQDHFEEIDHLAANKIQGANLGWSGYEGTHPYLDGDGRRPAHATPPVFEYSHDDGNCSITGGFVYRGKAIPALDGAFLFADYCAGRLRAITLGSDGKLAHEFDLGIDLESPVSFSQDQQGEPYILLQGGNIVRLLPAS